MSLLRQIGRTGFALIARPDLWFTSLRATLRLVPAKWWRNGLIPPRRYIEYRGVAVYGMPLHSVPAGEFIRYLEWCRAFPGPVR
jgi:hypothetical protein